jgi:2',3'-cyclic-nucleotide 2'-phosphodiesterase (5'-nucleotidase family)/ubiquinone/menaquinone biosynthesis C-methylase UbiE
MIRRLLAAAAFLLLGACVSTGPRQAPAPGTRTAVLMAINDVYRIEGLEGGRVAGLARVRALRKELERDHPDMLLLHGGDFLFPSFASRMYNGEQMVAVLNDLDGDPAAFDERMIVVFGNHELEKGKMKDVPMLVKRIGESRFRWLDSNIVFKSGEDGRPLVDSPNLIKSALVHSGGIAIGIFGLTVPTEGIQYADFAGPAGVARDLTARLRAQGAEVVIALTHLNAADDRELLETLGDAGPDLIVGGHDHEKMAVQVGRRLILKADADARTATVIHLSLAPDGKLDVAHEFRPLSDATPAPDPDTLSLVTAWQARHEKEFCAKANPANPAPGCLEELYGSTRTPLEAEETKIRNQETSVGDWVADLMKKEMEPCGAQVAFINSGSLRLNQDLPAGTKITRRHVEELFGYETPLRLVRIDGAILQQVIEQAVRGWPGSGTWLQISGFAWVHDTAGKKAGGLTLLTPQGPRPVRPDDEILAAVDDYLVNPEIGDQDGYDMLEPDRIVRSCAADGRDLKQVVVDALRAANPEGIAPKAEGRICQPGRPGRPCLAAVGMAPRTPAQVLSWKSADWLERPGRADMEKPEVTLGEMNLHDGDMVADIGAGTGFYSRRLARAVAPSGKVYANDIQPEMLERLAELAAKEGITNIVTVLGTESDLNLPPGTFDWVLLVDVYHEFQQPAAMLAKIREALKPNGRVALVEYRREGDTASHIPLAHRMTVEQVTEEWTAAGFLLERTVEDLPSQHLFILTTRRGVRALP